MQKEIIINATSNQHRIAIIEEGRLSELFIESEERERMVGDIYLGTVAKVMPGIQASFVDIGLEQDAFLQFSDIGDAFRESPSIKILKLLEEPVANEVLGARRHRAALVHEEHLGLVLHAVRADPAGQNGLGFILEQIGLETGPAHATAGPSVERALAELDRLQASGCGRDNPGMSARMRPVLASLRGVWTQPSGETAPVDEIDRRMRAQVRLAFRQLASGAMSSANADMESELASELTRSILPEAARRLADLVALGAQIPTPSTSRHSLTRRGRKSSMRWRAWTQACWTCSGACGPCPAKPTRTAREIP